MKLGGNMYYFWEPNIATFIQSLPVQDAGKRSAIVNRTRLLLVLHVMEANFMLDNPNQAVIYETETAVQIA